MNITESELRARFPGASKSTLARNMAALATLDDGYGGTLSRKHAEARQREGKAPEAKRIRQDTKPLLNKLEAAWLAVLMARYPGITIRAQARRYKLCSGAWYKPDLTAIINGKETAFECKGGSKMKGVAKGILALKFAAHEWPEVDFWLVWKEQGKWCEQKVLT